MKKVINISLILIFTMTFVACEKERIMPVALENQMNFDDLECDEDFDFDDSSVKSSNGDNHGDIIIDSVTDPDEDEDFDGEDKVTDPDEDEDFDGEDKNGENN